MSETQKQETQVSKNDKPYITKPNDQQDMERRLSDDYQADAELASRRTFVNPNPIGNEKYVGTDPIYQNYASETEKPLASQKGAEKKAEDAVKASYSFPDDVDKSRIVDDPGTGGQALLADISVPVPPSVTVPGQIGGRDSEKEESEKKEEPSGLTGPVTPTTPITPTGPVTPSSPTGS